MTISAVRPWQGLARRRRAVLTALILMPAMGAAGLMHAAMPAGMPVALELALVTVFTLLFAWISAGFWTALAGYSLLRRGVSYVDPGSPELRRSPPLPGVRVAVLMPIYNEDVRRVVAGLRATYLSLARSGALSHFDFFILSDSREPERWLEEELAWAELCKAVGGFGRIHYRRRPVNIKAKSGNVADFCRRWGSQYPYMVVLDADSVMSGATLVALLEMMEGNPRVGIIQTQPIAVNRETLYARIQQFAHRVYGPLFSAGLRFWQLGDGHYIGHNAILRVNPFMAHCALPRLPGKGPLGGPLLSHDFVEAALMARAGWEVWFAHNLEGSYEEVPPTLVDDLKRDRRWCQGNLQHLRLMGADGLRFAHRFLFLNGAMSYASAPLWALFLVLGLAGIFIHHWGADNGYPFWDELRHTIMQPFPLLLFSVTALLLFLPKILAMLLILSQGEKARRFGGRIGLVRSVFLESLFSMLAAPVRMAFHSQFVILTLLGKGVRWGGQVRDDARISWATAWRHFGVWTVLGVGLGGALYGLLGTGHFWWLSPVLVGFALAVPVAVYTSSARFGRWARRRGLFLIPEEANPPRELMALNDDAEGLGSKDGDDPFVRAVVDPYFNALHAALQRSRPRQGARAAALRRKALEHGPQSLTAGERRLLLSDRESMEQLHRAVWALADERQAARWGLGEPERAYA